MCLIVGTVSVTIDAAPTTPLYCERCQNPRPLGVLGAGRFWSRQSGRTILVTGGCVQVWCEVCHKEHALDLRGATPT